MIELLTNPYTYFAIYGIVTVVWLGVWRELEGEWVEDHLYVVLWPFLAICCIVFGIGWCLVWLGRGPVKLVRYLMRDKEPIPRATAKP